MAMVSLVEDLMPISGFRVRTAAIVAKVKRTKRPVFLTRRGRTVAVLQDAREYESKAQRLITLESILLGVCAAEKGEVVSHRKAMAQVDKVLDV